MQTELFDLPASRIVSEDPSAARTSFLEKTFVTLRFDQMIGLTLVLLVFFVMTFSWGVKKGKGTVSESQGMRSVPATILPPAPSIPVTPAVVKAALLDLGVAGVPREVPITVAELPKPVAKVTMPEGKFTIQHVTYVTQSAADREMKKLGEKGYSSFVIPSGKHLQVCIAAFQSRDEASQLLRRLKAQRLASSDAYVRPMVR